MATTGGHLFHDGFQEANITQGASSTTQEASRTTQEAGEATTGGCHLHTGHQEDTAPVEDWMRSTCRIGNSTDPSSTGSTPDRTYYRASACTYSIPYGEPFTTALPQTEEARIT